MLASMITGCAPARSGPYAALGDQQRQPAESERLNLKAAELLDEDTESSLREAESILREALTLDLYNGPAHNNLGIVYFRRGQLYEASGEFEWARKLMPGNPDPRINLAITLESAGRTTEALATYKTALEIAPESIAGMQGLAALQFRTRQTDEQTSEHLREIALRGEDDSWRRWAQAKLAER
jgi:Flp pilus assembly protein TadD